MCIYIYEIAYHNVSQILAHHSSSNLKGQPLASNSSRSRARTSARQLVFLGLNGDPGHAEWLPQWLLLDISFACGDSGAWMADKQSSADGFEGFFCVPSSGLRRFKYLNAFKRV